MFPKLPQEIQDMIWEAAMRRPTNGFHALYFRPTTTGLEDEIADTGSCIHGFNDPVSQRNWFKLECGERRLEAPRYLGKLIFDGAMVYNNPLSFRSTNQSLYLEDASVWTACKDSRRVMNRFHRRPRLSRLSLPQPELQASSSSAIDVVSTSTSAPNRCRTQSREVVATGSFPSDIRQAWCGVGDMIFHIMSEDIVCVQCDWARSDYDWTRHLPYSICKSLENVNHLAVEFE